MGDTFLNESVITQEYVGELLNAEKQELIISCLGQVGLEQVEALLLSDIKESDCFCVFGTRPVTNKETTVCTFESNNILCARLSLFPHFSS